MELIKLLPEVQEIEQSTSQFLNNALTVKVTDQISCTFANGLFLDAAERIKAIDSKLNPKRELAYRAYQEWLKLIKELKEPYEKARNHLNSQITPYIQEIKRQRQVEEEKLRQEMIMLEMQRRKAEEARRMEEAAALEQAGAKEEAEQVISEIIQETEAPIIVPPPPPVTPKVEVRGMASATNWKFEIIDEKLIPRSFLVPDLVKIGGIVRSLKAETNIPGIRAYGDSKMKATGRG